MLDVYVYVRVCLNVFLFLHTYFFFFVDETGVVFYEWFLCLFFIPVFYVGLVLRCAVMPLFQCIKLIFCGEMKERMPLEEDRVENNIDSVPKVALGVDWRWMDRSWARVYVVYLLPRPRTLVSSVRVNFNAFEFKSVENFTIAIECMAGEGALTSA